MISVLGSLKVLEEETLDYSAQDSATWKAQALLTELGIANEALLAEFGPWERDEIALISKADWPKRLRKMGAKGREDVQITAAMVRLELIK